MWLNLMVYLMECVRAGRFQYVVPFPLTAIRLYGSLEKFLELGIFFGTSSSGDFHEKMAHGGSFTSRFF